jgi:hypothetical protein
VSFRAVFKKVRKAKIVKKTNFRKDTKLTIVPIGVNGDG